MLFFTFPNENAKHGADWHPHVFGHGFEAEMFLFTESKRYESISFGHGYWISYRKRIVNDYFVPRRAFAFGFFAATSISGCFDRHTL